MSLAVRALGLFWRGGRGGKEESSLGRGFVQVQLRAEDVCTWVTGCTWARSGCAYAGLLGGEQRYGTGTGTDKGMND